MEFLLLFLMFLLNCTYYLKASERYETKFPQHDFLYNNTILAGFKNVKSKTCYVEAHSLEKVNKLSPQLTKFCTGNTIIFLPPLANSVYTKRIKRANGNYRPIRGQTQTQYLNFGKGNEPGKAEAQSTYESSRAVVSGNNGMGQAQSQSMGIDCRECPGQQIYSHPTAEIQLKPETFLKPGKRIPVPYAPGTPEAGTYIPGAPRPQGGVDIPGKPGKQYAPGIPGAPTGPFTPGIPPHTSLTPGLPRGPEMPGTMGTQYPPKIPEASRPYLPGAPGMWPGTPDLPRRSEIPSIPGVPGQYVPGVPGIPAHRPGIPIVPTGPHIPGTPGLEPYIPGIVPGLGPRPGPPGGKPDVYIPGRIPELTPSVPGIPGTPMRPDTPGAQYIPGTPGVALPYHPGAPRIPEGSYMPGIPGRMYTPGGPGDFYQSITPERKLTEPFVPGTPGGHYIPEAPGQPYIPAAPRISYTPRAPQGQLLPDTSTIPGRMYIPGTPVRPYVPGIPSTTYTPGISTISYRPEDYHKPGGGTFSGQFHGRYDTHGQTDSSGIIADGSRINQQLSSDGQFSGRFAGGYDSRTGQNGTFAGQFSGTYDHHKEAMSAPGQYIRSPGAPTGPPVTPIGPPGPLIGPPGALVGQPGAPVSPPATLGQYIPEVMATPGQYRPAIPGQYLPDTGLHGPTIPGQYAPGQIPATPYSLDITDMPSQYPETLGPAIPGIPAQQYGPGTGIPGQYTPDVSAQYPSPVPQGPPGYPGLGFGAPGYFPGMGTPGFPAQYPTNGIPDRPMHYIPGPPGQYAPTTPGITPQPDQYTIGRPQGPPGGPTQYVPGGPGIPPEVTPTGIPGQPGSAQYIPGQYSPSGPIQYTPGQYLPGPPGTITGQYVPGAVGGPGYGTAGVPSSVPYVTNGIPGQYPSGITPGGVPGGTGYYTPGTGAISTSIPGHYKPGDPGQYVPGTIPGDYTPGELGPSQYRPGVSGEYERPAEQTYYRPGEKPEELVLSKDDGQSQAESSVQQVNNETQASASAQGSYQGGTAQSQVSGIYSGSGSFSASAGTIDGKRGVQTSVSGGKEGAISSSQGSGGASQSQSQVQVASATGETSSSAQSGGINHGTNTQVQASEKGGMADAQANGPGKTSSQAQIGFMPYDKDEQSNQKTPFKGGGAASAQGGAYTGQSQAQIQGKFVHGIRYTGAAQAGSGTNASLSRNQPKPPGVSSIFKPITSTTEKTDMNTLMSDNSVEQNTIIQENISETTTPQSPRKKTQEPRHDKVDDDYDYNDPEYDDTIEPSSAVNTRTLIKQETNSQKQQIVIDPLEELDATVIQDHGNKLPIGTVLHPGQLIPGSSGLRIPTGFRGKVTSMAGEHTEAHGRNSQAQTVTLTPGTGRAQYKKPVYTVQSKSQLDNGGFGYGTSYTYQPVQYHVRSGDSYPKFVSVVKTENGYQSPHTGKKVPSVYYTQTSSCGYFTNTCVYNNGKKICMPKPKTNPDGSPMKC